MSKRGEPKGMPRVVKLILSSYTAGTGKEGDPYRTVFILTTLDGKAVAEDQNHQWDFS